MNDWVAPKTKNELAGVIWSEVGAPMLTVTETPAIAQLPARSDATTLIELDTDESGTVHAKFDPDKLAGTLLQDTLATPERASVAVPVIATYGVLTTAPLDGLVMLRVGGVISRLIVALVVPVLFAVSVAVPDTAWLAPSVLTVTGEEQL